MTSMRMKWYRRRQGIIAALTLFAMLATVLPVSSAGQERRKSTEKAEVKKEQADIIQLEHRWLRAEHTGDVSTLKRILANDLLRPYPAGGTFVGKKEMLDYARSHGSSHGTGRPRGHLPKFAQLHVWIYHGTAIARGILTITNSEGNILHKTLFTDVFVRREGRWQAVSAQENEVPAR